MNVNHVHIKCSILKIVKLEQKYLEISQIYTKDERLIFRDYVLALCRLNMPFGRIDRLKNEIVVPHINQMVQKVKSVPTSSDNLRIMPGNCRKL